MGPARASFFRQPVRIIKEYRKVFLRPDLIAGLTVAAVAIPQGIAYAAIADLPPSVGLFTAVVATIVGALWGSSKQLSTGPTNATSLLVLSVLLGAGLAPAIDLDRYLLAAGMIAVLAGVFAIVLAYLRFGALVTLASRPVLVGFTVGAAVLIAVGQLRHLFRLDTPATPDLHVMLSDLFGNIPETHLPSLALGAGTFALILVLKLVHKRIPAMFIALVAAAAAVGILGLDGHGVAVVGEIPRTLPPPTLLARESLPDFGMVRDLVLGAMAVAALGLIEAMAIAQTLARRAGTPLDNNQEFYGQGLANVASGMLSGYACSGSFTRSALNHEAGAKTQLASVIAGLVILLAMLLLAPWAGNIPRAALAGVLLYVSARMVDIPAIRRVFLTSRAESAIMLATFGATLTLPLVFAILGGVVLSLAYFVMRSSLPRVFQVVPDPTFRHFVESPELPTCPQLGVVTIRGPLFFGAVHHVQEALQHNLERYPGQNHLVIRMHGVELIDLTGIEMIESTVRHHRRMGGDVYLIRLRRPVCEAMEEAGFLDVLGRDHILEQEGAIEHLFERVIDPSVCIYECPHRVFAECQALQKHDYPDGVPPGPACVAIDEERLLEVDRARVMMDADEAELVDVREESEFASGHQPGARLVPLRLLLARKDELPRDKPLLLTCRSGRRTRRAMRMLRDAGFDDVYGVRGGYLAWLAAGLPHTTGSD